MQVRIFGVIRMGVYVVVRAGGIYAQKVAEVDKA